MLRLRQISHKYGRNLALENINWSIKSGVTALLGPNGAGKSTLLSILTGALRPTSGDLIHERENGAERGLTDPQTVAFVPQQLYFENHLTCESVLTYSLWLNKRAPQFDDLSISMALSQVDMEGLRKTKVGALSGGMIRRLALAQAIVVNPDIIVLDEPTVGLDPAQRHIFHKYLTEHIEGRIVIYATHLAEDVAASASEVGVISEGRLIFTGSLASFCAPENISADAISAAYSLHLDNDRRNRS